MKAYNKGEWSEPYLLLKLISDQKLYIGGENFNKVEGLFYRIVKILHFEKTKNTTFSFDGDIILIKNGSTPIRLPVKKFIDISKLTLDRINSVKSKKGSFNIPELMNFLNSINISEVKSKSTQKNDITIQIEDPNTFITPTLGFSVKSQLGKPATLVNASNATNFTYTLSKKLNKSQINEINEQRKFSDKFKIFDKYNVSLTFDQVDNPKFNINLQTIDYNFSKLLSDILIMYYANDITSENTIEKFTNRLSIKNEFKYDLNLNPDIYQMIVKRFLVEYALGMRASQIWKRDYQADGGYLIVREDGEIICYHFYFVKNFENYLYQNTKLETPDKNRYHMAEIYEENGTQKLKLNLQIRFIK
ncbi:HpaII family restriction endonuclease [Winogradskyella psychrotolerans]|uniref:HpaII family restriction endonuclease n=1 Tax=Winogradskyella psychrotolerans TaxID=1344585 RepID=UPI001C06DDD9|nr:HpaII family restriction endonuclease [Winogradskyella psychrotolerans]MBU2928390.1 HpaII family restriction endonuclease [Winogradskyella psychrotolerans]